MDTARFRTIEVARAGADVTLRFSCDTAYAAMLVADVIAEHLRAGRVLQIEVAAGLADVKILDE